MSTNKSVLKPVSDNLQKNLISNMPIMNHITPLKVMESRKFSILEIQGAENFFDMRQLIGIFGILY